MLTSLYVKLCINKYLLLRLMGLLASIDSKKMGQEWPECCENCLIVGEVDNYCLNQNLQN